MISARLKRTKAPRDVPENRFHGYMPGTVLL